MEHEILKMLEEVDEKIKEKLKEPGMLIWEKTRLAEAREHVQEAISAILQ